LETRRTNATIRTVTARRRQAEAAIVERAAAAAKALAQVERGAWFALHKKLGVGAPHRRYFWLEVSTALCDYDRNVNRTHLIFDDGSRTHA
jgi:hypothetical protein